MENGESGLLGSDRGGIVTARGTGDGLVIRLDGRVDAPSLREALNEFIVSRKAFLSGNEVFLEWVGRLPEQGFIDELSTSLADDYNVTVKASRLRDQRRVGVEEDDAPSVEERTPERDGPAILSVRSAGDAFTSPRRGGFQRERSRESEPQKRYSLFDGMEAVSSGSPEGRGSEIMDRESRLGLSDRMGLSDRIGIDRAGSDRGIPDMGAGRDKSRMAVNPLLWDDPDARVIHSTLRGGQRVESDHSVIVFGDVNSGAEVIAGGDIVVLGTLRGVAHAGAYDETGGGRVIFALNLLPTQLRIGSVISRGQNEASRVPEIARIEGNMIMVEDYQSRSGMARSAAGKRRD